jgi:hypothetical protein
MADPGGEGALRRSWKKDLQQNRPVPLLILLLHAQALKTKAIMLTVNDFLMWTPLQTPSIIWWRDVLFSNWGARHREAAIQGRGLMNSDRASRGLQFGHVRLKSLKPSSKSDEMEQSRASRAVGLAGNC